jgi:ubiquinone/menaquinone biosynthesis C-methylase UbiE
MTTRLRRAMSSIEQIAFFTEVDRTKDPNFFVRFLDEGNALPSIRASKAIILEELRLSDGQLVLDAGCGTGADALPIAKVMGSNGRVVGLDVSETLIGEAKARSLGSNLPVEFEVGDAQALRFDDDTFDACRTERMLMHVPDADRALSELIRVTRVGGQVGAFELDLDTLVVDSPDRDTTRALVRSLSDEIRHGWIGRQLPRMFKERGMTDVRVTPHTVFFHYEFLQLLVGGHLTHLQEAGVLLPEEVMRWWASVREAQQADAFLAAVTGFIVAGTKA